MSARRFSLPTYIWFPSLGTLTMGFLTLNIAPASAQFMRQLGVGHAGLSLFLSALMWTHALAQIPAGVVVDRLGVSRSMHISIGIMLVSNLLPLLLPTSFAFAIFCRLFTGLSTALLFLAAVRALTLLTPPAYFVQTQGIQGGCFALGTMLPYIILPLFGAVAWISSYLVSVAFAILLFIALRGLVETLRVRDTLTVSTSSEVWQALKRTAGHKTIWIIGCFHGFSYGSMTTIASWLPEVLQENAGSGTTARWAMATGIAVLMGVIGRFSGGQLGRKYSQQRIIEIVTLVVGILFCVMGFIHNPWLILGAGFFMCFICGLTYASIFTITTICAEKGYVATSVGLMNMVSNLLGVLLILILGNVREWTGHFSMGFLVAGMLALVLAVSCWRILKRAGKKDDAPVGA